MIAETIHWRRPAAKLPDSDLTVIINCPDADEPVWLGYHDGECWRDVSGGMISDEVTHWAEMPAGPSTTTPKARNARAPRT